MSSPRWFTQQVPSVTFAIDHLIFRLTSTVALEYIIHPISGSRLSGIAIFVCLHFGCCLKVFHLYSGKNVIPSLLNSTQCDWFLMVFGRTVIVGLHSLSVILTLITHLLSCLCEDCLCGIMARELWQNCWVDYFRKQVVRTTYLTNYLLRWSWGKCFAPSKTTGVQAIHL